MVAVQAHANARMRCAPRAFARVAVGPEAMRPLRRRRRCLDVPAGDAVDRIGFEGIVDKAMWADIEDEFR